MNSSAVKKLSALPPSSRARSAADLDGDEKPCRDDLSSGAGVWVSTLIVHFKAAKRYFISQGALAFLFQKILNGCVR